MLRTVGSSLLAKASPGGAFRKAAEQKIENTAITGQGGIGSVSRNMLEQPIERQVPAGSSKVVSSSPSVESVAKGAIPPSGMNTAEPMSAPGIGLPPGGVTPARGASPAPSAPRAPDVGLMKSTLRSSVAPGKTGAQVSGGAIPNAGAVAQPGQGEVLGDQSSPVSVQGQAGQQDEMLGIKGPVFGKVGGKVFADPGQKVNTATTGQTIAGPVGTVLRTLSLGQGPMGQVANKLTNYAYNPKAAASGTGSVSKAVGTAASALRSIVQQVAPILKQSPVSWLRSLFKK